MRSKTKLALGQPGIGFSRLGKVSHLAAVLVTLVTIVAVGMFAEFDVLDAQADGGGIHASAGLGGQSEHPQTGDDHSGCGPTPGCVLAISSLSGQVLLWSISPAGEKKLPTNTILAKKNDPTPSDHVPIGRYLQA